MLWQGLPLLPPHPIFHVIHLLPIHPFSPLESFLIPLFFWRLIPVPFIQPYVMLHSLNNLFLWTAWLNINSFRHILNGSLPGPFPIIYINSPFSTYVPRWNYFHAPLSLNYCMKRYL